MIPTDVFSLNDGNAIALYAVLAKHAKNGTCWPSMKRLESSLGWTETRIRPAMKKLVESGFVSIGKRKLHGMDQSNVYKITAYEQVPRDEVAVPHSEVMGTSPRRLGYLTTRDEQEPLEQQPIEQERDDPPNPPGGTARKAPTRDELRKNPESEAFVAFYADYPRKTDRQNAWVAWQKLNPDDAKVAEVMGGLHRLTVDYQKRSPEKIPHPSTFLNGARWNDDPVIPYSFRERIALSANGSKSASELGAEIIRRNGERDMIDTTGRVM